MQPTARAAVSMIAAMATDCVPCHFEYEEEQALPHLPPHFQDWLRREHAFLKEAGYPAADVITHAKREMPIFRRFVPAHIVENIELDHRRFHPVLADCARRGELAPTTRIV